MITVLKRAKKDVAELFEMIAARSFFAFFCVIISIVDFY